MDPRKPLAFRQSSAHGVAAHVMGIVVACKSGKIENGCVAALTCCGACLDCYPFLPLWPVRITDGPIFSTGSAGRFRRPKVIGFSRRVVASAGTGLFRGDDGALAQFGVLTITASAAAGERPRQGGLRLCATRFGRAHVGLRSWFTIADRTMRGRSLDGPFADGSGTGPWKDRGDGCSRKS
jgi:hypothetical protein